MQVSVAPIALATSRLSKPIGPAPHTSTLCPRRTSPVLQACIATDSGSSMAPSSNDTLSGSLQAVEIQFSYDKLKHTHAGSQLPVADKLDANCSTS